MIFILIHDYYYIQRSDWKLHQLECQAFLRLTEDRRKLITSSIRLMVRIFLKKKLQYDQVDLYDDFLSLQICS